MATRLYLRQADATGVVPNAKQSADTIQDDFASVYASYAFPATMSTTAGPTGITQSAVGTNYSTSHFSHYGTWISPPLAAQTVSGTVTIGLSMTETNAKQNNFPRVKIYKWLANDTFGSDILALATSGTEIGTGYALVTYFNATAITSTTFAAGDRIVIEVEDSSVSPSDNTNRVHGIQFDGADSGAYGSYVSFSANISWQTTTTTVTFTKASQIRVKTTQNPTKQSIFRVKTTPTPAPTKQSIFRVKTTPTLFTKDSLFAVKLDKSFTKDARFEVALSVPTVTFTKDSTFNVATAQSLTKTSEFRVKTTGANASVTPSFSRNSPAYKNDGSQVSANNPRFERFASVNLLAGSKAGVTRVNLVGFEPIWTPQLTREIDPQYHVVGEAAVKVVTQNAHVDEGVRVQYTIVAPSQTYTASCWLCGNGTITLFIQERTADDQYVAQSGTAITLTSIPTRYSVTRAFGSTGARTQIDIKTQSQQSATFYASGFQLEVGSAATVWMTSDRTYGSTTLELGTQNLLTANQSSFETDLTGFEGDSGVLIALDSSEYFVGSKSLKVVCTEAIDNKGFYTFVTTGLSPSTVYTASAYVKAPVGATLKLQVSDNTDLSTSTYFTGTGSWQRVSVSQTTDAHTTLCVVVRTNSAQVVTFHVDGLQLEQKAYTTSWMTGTATRNEEYISYPLTVAKGSEGTFEFVATISDITLNVHTTDQYLIMVRAGSVYFGILASWYYKQIRATTSSGWFTGNFSTIGTHRFALKWNAAEASWWVDGVKTGFISNPTLPSDTLTFLRTQPACVQFSDAVFSHIARTDADLAKRGKILELGADEYTSYYLPLKENLAPVSTFKQSRFAVKSTKLLKPAPVMSNDGYVTANLRHYYNFLSDSGTTVVDSSGNGYNGTATGTTLVSDGVRGQGRHFSRSQEDSVSLTNSWPNSSDQPLSYEFAFKLDDLNARHVLIGQAYSRNVLLITTGGAVKFYGTDSGGTDWSYSTNGGLIKPGVYYHLVLTYDNTVGDKRLRLYVNGKEITSGAFPNNYEYVLGNFGTSVIGCADIEGDYRYLNGNILLFRCYTVPLTAAEVTQNYTDAIGRVVAYLPGYAQRKKVTLNHSGEVIGYQKKLSIWNIGGTDSGENVYLGSDSKSWPIDIRFTASDGTTPLDFWRESNDANKATVWVEYDQLNGDQDVYLYYGRANDTDSSDGSTTFPFFSDFSVNLDKWNVGGSGATLSDGMAVIPSDGGWNSIRSKTVFKTNYAVRSRLKCTPYNYIGADKEATAGWGEANNAEAAVSYFNGNGATHGVWYNEHLHAGNAWAQTGISDNTFFVMDIARNGSANTKFTANDANLITGESNPPSSTQDMYTVHYAYNSVQTIDWSLVRVYTLVEPTVTWGTAELNTAPILSKFAVKTVPTPLTKASLFRVKTTQSSTKASLFSVLSTQSPTKASDFRVLTTPKKNLCTNPNFSIGTAGWTIYHEVTGGITQDWQKYGDWCLRIRNNYDVETNWGAFYQNDNIHVGNRSITVNLYFKTGPVIDTGTTFRMLRCDKDWSNGEWSDVVENVQPDTEYVVSKSFSFVTDITGIIIGCQMASPNSTNTNEFYIGKLEILDYLPKDSKFTVKTTQSPTKVSEFRVLSIPSFTKAAQFEIAATYSFTKQSEMHVKLSPTLTRQSQFAVATESETGWLHGYVSRKKVTFTHSGAIAGYQKSITIVAGVGVDSDDTVYLNNNSWAWPDDIRFTQVDGTTLLPFWREESDTTDGLWWVKYDQTDGDVEGYLYFGKLNATDVSSGTDTFPVLHEHFDDSTINTDIWKYNNGGSESGTDLIVTPPASWALVGTSSDVFGTNYAFRSRWKTGVDNDSVQVGWRGAGDDTICFKTGASTCYPKTVSGSNLSEGTSVTSNPSAYHTYDVARNSTTDCKFSYDNGTPQTITTNFPAGDLQACFFVDTFGNTLVVDWALIRKVAETEPTVTWSEAETREANGYTVMCGPVQVFHTRDTGQQMFMMSGMSAVAMPASVYSYIPQSWRSYSNIMRVSASASASVSKKISTTISHTLTAVASISKKMNATISGVATSAASIPRKISTTISNIATPVATIPRKVGKTISNTLTGAVATSRKVGKNLSVAAVGVLTSPRKIGKIIALTVTVAAAISKKMNELLTMTVSATVQGLASLSLKLDLKRVLSTQLVAVSSLSLRIRKTLAGQATVTATISVLKRFYRTLTVTSIAIRSMPRKIGSTLSISSNAVASALKKVPKTVSAVSTAIPAIPRKVGKTIALTVTAVAAIPRKVGKTISNTVVTVPEIMTVVSGIIHKVLSVSSTVSVSLPRKISTTIAGAVVAMATVPRKVGKTVLRQSAIVASVLTLKTTLKTLSVTSTVVRSMPRKIGKTVSMASAPVASIVKKMFVRLSATASTVANVRKTAKRVMAAAAVASLSLVKRVRKTVSIVAVAIPAVSRYLELKRLLSATVTGAASLTMWTSRGVAVLASVSGAVTTSLGKKVRTTITVQSTAVATVVKKVRTTISNTVNGMATIPRVIGKTIGRTVVSTAIIPRVIGKTIGHALTGTAAIPRKVGKYLEMQVTGSVSLSAFKIWVKSLAAVVTSVSIIGQFRRLYRTLAPAISVAAILNTGNTYYRTLAIAISTGAIMRPAMMKFVTLTVTMIAAPILRALDMRLVAYEIIKIFSTITTELRLTSPVSTIYIHSTITDTIEAE